MSQDDLDLINYINSKEYEQHQKVITLSYNKELEAVIRKTIKVKIKQQGALAYFGKNIPEGSSHYGYLKEYDEIATQEEWHSTLSAQDTVALYVTLSPEPGTVDPIVLADDLLKIYGKKRKGVRCVRWNIEQSGTHEQDNIGHHPHSHALVFLDKSNEQGERGRVKAMLTRNFQKYKTKTEAYLQIKPVSQKSVAGKINYIDGYKTDEHKLCQVEADKDWRDQLGIEEVYEFPEYEPEEVLTEDGIELQ